MVPTRPGHQVRDVALALGPLLPDLVVGRGRHADEPPQVRALDEERDREVDEVDRQREQQPRLLEHRRAEDGDEPEAGQRQPEPDDDRAVRLGLQQALDHAAVRVDRRTARPQRERQEDRRQEQADRQRDVRRPAGAGRGSRHRRAIVGDRPFRPARRASSATQSPSVEPPVDDQARGLEGRADLRLAVDEDPRRERGCRPGRSSSRSGRRERDEDAGDEVGERRRRTAGSPLGRLPTRARIRRAMPLRRAFAVVASTAIGSVSTPNARAAPRRTAAMARIPEPHPTSRTRAPASARRGPPAPRAPRGTAASSGGGRSRTPCPGRARGRRRPATAGGGATSGG